MGARRLAMLAVVWLAACAAPDPDPLAPRLAPHAPTYARLDAASGGRAGFYFAPPIAPALAVYPGTFDGSRLASLAVRVCPIDGTGACTGTDSVYTQSTKPAVTLNLVDQTYGVTWSPRALGDFRARVYAGTTRLGFADVRVVGNGADLRKVPPGYVGLVKNAALPIRFRIETGVVARVSIATVPQWDSLPGFPIATVGVLTIGYAATVTDLDGNTIASPSLAWTSSDPSIATISPADASPATATGVAEGEVTITATSGGVWATRRLGVFGPPDAVIANATRVVPRADACGNVAGRTCESLVGNAIADALRAAYVTDFAIVNSGGLRAALTCPTVDLPTDHCPPYTPTPYPITRGQLAATMPFANLVAHVTVTGAELKMMLENGVSVMPTAHGKFPQVSGLCFTYLISALPGARVTSVVRQASDGSCTGAAVDLSATSSYTLVENDFMASGGDDYPNFGSRAVTGRIESQAVALSLAATGMISPKIQGRIACTSGGVPACPVVVP